MCRLRMPIVALAVVLVAAAAMPGLAQTIANAEVAQAVQVFRQGDAAAAERQLRALAARDAEAAAWLAVVLLANETPQRLGEAVGLLQRAAASGNAEAQHNLAIQYALGRGVPQDDRRAFELFSQAAAQGHSRAQVNLATLYAQGRGTGRDPAQARTWYERAATGNDPYALFALGHQLEGESGGQARAVDLYRRAADQGHLGAALRLGRMLAAGSGTASDPAAAALWLQHAAQNGVPEAALALGDLIAQRAARSDSAARQEAAKSAAQWYRLAADAGVAPAQFKLGNLYFAGAGVPRDFAAAQSWYTRGAEQGHPDSAYTLGVWLSGGVGGTTDPVAGLRWLAIAEKAGHPDAGLVRGRAAEKLTAAQVAQAEQQAARFTPRIERPTPALDSLPLKPRSAAR
jgi:TPR repeat protein